MSGRFTGWPPEAFDVLLRLDGDPPADVRKENRKDREQLVRQPMIALLHAVADADDAYEDFSVWGLGTMTWPWQHQNAMVRVAAKFEFGLRFDLDGLWVQGGWAHRHLDRYRAAVAREPSGRELTGIIATLRDKGFDIESDTMRRGPRGYPADHPRAELLRHRLLAAGRPVDDDSLHTPKVVDHVLTIFHDLHPLMSWLTANVADDCQLCRDD
jgi:hypothetical protein